MAQTFVVITAGIDLSVGMVFVLTNCLASWIVVGTARDGRARRRRRAAGRPRLRRDQRRSSSSIGRLQPIVTTIATGAVFFGLALAAAADARRRRLWTARRRADRPRVRRRCRRASSRSPSSSSSSGCRIAARRSAARPTRSARRRPAAYMSGVPVDARQVLRLRAVGPGRVARRPVPDLRHLFRRGLRGERRHLHALSRSPRWCSAASRCSAARAAPSARSSARWSSARSAISCSSSISIRCGSRCSRAWCCSPPSALGAARLFQVRNRLELFA